MPKKMHGDAEVLRAGGFPLPITLKGGPDEPFEVDVTATICRELAMRYKPANLSFILYIETTDTNNILYQNYGSSNITVYKLNDQHPLVLDNMVGFGADSYFSYSFESMNSLSIPVDSLIRLIRRCRGVELYHDLNPYQLHNKRTFDEPNATIVPSLKRLLTSVWGQASSKNLKLDLRLAVVLDNEQQQQLHQHCSDISPEESYEMVNDVTGVAQIFFGQMFESGSQDITLDTSFGLKLSTRRRRDRRFNRNMVRGR